MPKCIDDPSRSYTGKEPSPKGLGYCAHTHSVGTTKKGNDGNTWTVETTYKGTKRWVKKSGSGKRRSTKHTSKKTSRGKRTSKKKTSGKRKHTSKKKTSNKRKRTKRASTKKTSCAKIPRLKGYTLKSGQKYTISIQGIDVTNDADYERHLKNFVYNPSTFKQKIEKVLCSWTKGNKVTVKKFELWNMDEYNNGWIDIQWK